MRRMMITPLAAAALAFACTAAMAQTQNNGLGGVGAQGNGYGGDASANAGAIAGASASSGSASSVIGSGNSSNRLSQEMLQALYSKQTLANYSPSKASTGAVSLSNNIEGDDAAASTAVAGRGVPGDCMGSSGVGVQTMGAGVSLGSNWFDEKCREERRARQIEAVNKTAALALLCMDGDTREAFKVASKLSGNAADLCPQDRVEAAARDLKKATYWQDQKGVVHRVARTDVTMPDGVVEAIAWKSPRQVAGIAIE